MQPPSGGCVLKLIFNQDYNGVFAQPPSGGCVLKQLKMANAFAQKKAAAFGRLCVETRSDFVVPAST